MLRNIYLNIIFVIIATQFSFSQRLYLRIDNSNVSTQKFIKDYNIKSFIIFNEPKFLTGENLDSIKLVKSLTQEFPKRNANNFLVLNWEQEGIDVLTNQRSIAKFNYYLREYKRAIKIIKKFRPEIKVAFYGLPFPRWNENDRSFEQKVYKIVELLKMQDFIAPSLYILYSSDTQRTLDFTNYNMNVALKLGQLCDKPVYPFIWHRAHPLDKKYAWQLLSPTLFQKVVKVLVSTNYNGKKIDGVFWWHSENNGYSKNATKSELRNEKNVDAYRYDIFKKYYNSIKYIIK